MKFQSVLFLIAGVVVSYGLSLFAVEPSRLWRTKKGEELEAVWDTASDTPNAQDIRLAKDGKFFRVKIDKLSEVDRNYIEERRVQASKANVVQESDFVSEEVPLEEESLPTKKIPRKAGEKKTLTVKGIDYTFRWCPPGEFWMGSIRTEPGRFSDELRHKVILTRGFWMLESEVTQGMWESVTGVSITKMCEMGSFIIVSGLAPSCPMFYTSWDDAKAFCEELSDLIGIEAVLPTEAQWEYACRAGTEGPYGGTGNLDDMGWYKTPDHEAHDVKTKQPNAWGLYDMHGNVWEWCRDYAQDYPEVEVVDPTGPIKGSVYAVRGGSWDDVPANCRSANRGYNHPYYRSRYLGFRFVINEDIDE